MNKNLVIVTSNFESFIASLKQNMKLGYCICASTEYRNGFFRASLLQGIDENYVSKLKAISGKEVENCLDLTDYLGNTSPTQEIKQAVELFDPVKPVKTSDVEVTLLKPSLRKPRKNRGESK